MRVARSGALRSRPLLHPWWDMPSDKNRANMGWRERLPAAKSPAGKRDWQGQAPAAAVKKPGWSRRSKFTFVGLAFLGCAAVAVWLILKLFPPKPAILVLIGADYNETSLAIPHNEYGWQGPAVRANSLLRN